MIAAAKPLARLFAFVLALSFFTAPRARAELTVGDAVLTVGVSTLAGTVLGASTLPFYGTPGDHTQNIFYGAAIGAVVGVFIAAYAGVQEGPGDDVHYQIPARAKSALSVNDSAEFRLQAETTTTIHRAPLFGSGAAVAWSPVASLQF